MTIRRTSYSWIEASLYSILETVKKCPLFIFCRFSVVLTPAPDTEWTRTHSIKGFVSGIKLKVLIYSSKYNGATERSVQTVESALKSFTKFNELKFLFNHRRASVTCKLSPAEILLGRHLRGTVKLPFFMVFDKCYITGTILRKFQADASNQIYTSKNTAWVKRDHIKAQFLCQLNK